MSGRTARGNRVGLGLTGLTLLAAGGYALTRSLGGFGPAQAEQPLYPETIATWLHTNTWIWLIVAALAVIIGIIAVRWLLVQLRTERLHRVVVDLDPRGIGDLAAGRSALPAAALTTAVGREIQTYPGVRAVRSYLTGAPDQPQLNLNVTLDANADAPRIHDRIVTEAVAHARTTLDNPDLPTQLRLNVARPTRDRRNYI